MIVISIMGILIAIAAPNLKVSIIRAREAVLREDLFQMREAIDQYYADNGKFPPTLKDLINAQDRTRSYLRDIPKDPFTGADDWITVAPEGTDAEGGVFDVHSASPLLGRGRHCVQYLVIVPHALLRRKKRTFPGDDHQLRFVKYIIYHGNPATRFFLPCCVN